MSKDDRTAKPPRNWSEREKRLASELDGWRNMCWKLKEEVAKLERERSFYHRLILSYRTAHGLPPTAGIFRVN